MTAMDIKISKFLRTVGDACREFADRLDERRNVPGRNRLGLSEAPCPSSLPSGRLALRVPEAAEVIGLSKANMYQLVARGEVRAVRLGRRIIVPVSELQRLLELQEC